ncbi:MAG: hypothetical protein AAF500_18995 [Myxococcota bacterium]
MWLILLMGPLLWTLLACVLWWLAFAVVGRSLFAIRLDSGRVTGPSERLRRCRVSIPITDVSLQPGSSFEADSFRITSTVRDESIHTFYLSPASRRDLRRSLDDEVSIQSGG